MHILSLLRRFLREEKASVMLLFGISVMVLVGVAGAGIDISRQQILSIKLQEAADAAATSTAAMVNAGIPPVSGSTVTDQEIAIAKRYYQLNVLNQDGSASPQPSIQVTDSGNNIQITNTRDALSQIRTTFLNVLGISKLQSAGTTKVAAASSTTSSDYDVALVVDESGSEASYDHGGSNYPGCGQMTPMPNSRMWDMQIALRNMVNTILPTTNTNPNVRIGIMGFSGQITNKWGLTTNNATLQAAINGLRPTNQNYDHWGMEAGGNLISGGTAGVADGRIGGGYCDGTVNRNTTAPQPRTARTNPSDANGMSPLKYVIFLSDGGIMIEPAPSQAQPCANGNPCYDAFVAACTAVKNKGGTDNVHLIIVDFVTPVNSAQGQALKACASTTLVQPKTPYPASQKPDITKEFYFAPDNTTLNTILTNVTQQIQSIRIVQ